MLLLYKEERYTGYRYTAFDMDLQETAKLNCTKKYLFFTPDLQIQMLQNFYQKKQNFHAIT